MGLETHVTVKMECDDWSPLEETLSVIRREYPFAAEIVPYFSIPIENKEDLYTSKGAVRRSSYQKKNGKTMYVMELEGDVSHLSVVNWFIIPIDQLKKAYEEKKDWDGDEGFFLKAITSMNEWKITCESHGIENLDNHKIKLTHKACGNILKDNIKLVIDGKEVKDNGYAVLLKEE